MFFSFNFEFFKKNFPPFQILFPFLSFHLFQTSDFEFRINKIEDFLIYKCVCINELILFFFKEFF